jgi:hypothetical protein
MRKAGFVGLALLLATAFGATSAGAQRPEHDVGTAGPDAIDVCGVPGMATARFNSLATELGDGSLFFRGSVTVRFTADETGKVITIHSAGPLRQQEIVDEDAGTITFIGTGSGVPQLVRAGSGGVLLRDAGRIVNWVQVFEFDPVTGEVGDRISNDWDFLAGPHPDLESDFERFCDVVEPYLLDA